MSKPNGRRSPAFWTALGAWIILIPTVFAGVFWLGHLNGRIDALSTQSIVNARIKAEASIEEKRQRILQELSMVEQGFVRIYSGSTKPDLGEGWVVCGQEGTIDLKGRYLLGANSLESVGTRVGSSKHTHFFTEDSTYQNAVSLERPRGGARDYYGESKWGHSHVVAGRTQSSDSRPASTAVMFYCKREVTPHE